MIVATNAIVILTLKYGDTSLIVKCLTETSGMHTYLLKGILKAKKGKLKAAYFQPLTLLEIVANHKNNGTLETLREAKVSYPYHSIHTDIHKNAIAFFISEILAVSIYEEEQNKSMFEFIETALRWLDLNEEISNFHIAFLMMLSRYLGFYPDDSRKELPFFDLQEGEFTHTETSTTLKDQNLEDFKCFLGIIFDAIHTIKLTKERRATLLNNLIIYFELHLQGFKKPKSIAVLNEVFR